MSSTPIPNCLCCDGELTPLIDFGRMPLVNTYDHSENMPLSVQRCLSCCHLQLSEAVDPHILYSNYAYCSGTGRIATDFFRSFARMAVECVPNAQTVLDIASNDGSQLNAFAELGLSTNGVDPAENLAPLAEANGHNIQVSLFEDARFDEGAKFDIITAQNVAAHSGRPLEFLQKCVPLMHSASRLFIATSQANMVVNGECDTIYHEHISYFNASSMRRLSERAGLKLLDIAMNDIHGTSYVFVLGLEGEANDRVVNRALWERAVGIESGGIYDWWKSHVAEKIERIRTQIERFKRDGYYTVGCGAAAKGISILNMAGVKLDILVDNTQTKWGKVASGMEISPFAHIASLKAEKILFVILAWNVGTEIRRNTEALRNQPQDVFIEVR